MIFAPFAFQNQIVTSVPAGPTLNPTVYSGTFLYLNASASNSYPGTGTNWNSIAPTGSSVTASLVNGVIYESGSIKSFNFDGTDDYGTIPYYAAASPTTGITILAWVYLDTYDSNRSIVSKANQVGVQSPYLQYGLKMDGNSSPYNRPQWNVNVGGTLREVNGDDITIPLNAWVLIAGTYDGGTLKIYKNGVQSTTTTGISGSISAFTTDIELGRWNGNGTQLWDGKMSLIMGVDRALTTAEILNIYNETKTYYYGVLSNPTIDTGSLKIWYDVGNPACYNGSTTLNNLVTGGTFDTATQANTGNGTITIDSGSRSVGFNKTTSGTALNYAYQNLGSITRTSGLTYWGFIRKNSGTNYGAQWCFLNDYTNSKVANLLIDTTYRDGIRSEYNTGASGYVTVWNTKTITVGTWYFAAYTVNVNGSATITMIQSDDTVATSSTFNNSSPSNYTPTIAGFGITDALSGTFNWSVGAHGVYEKTMTATEMRAIRSAYTSLGYYV